MSPNAPMVGDLARTAADAQEALIRNRVSELRDHTRQIPLLVQEIANLRADRDAYRARIDAATSPAGIQRGAAYIFKVPVADSLHCAEFEGALRAALDGDA